MVAWALLAATAAGQTVGQPAPDSFGPQGLLYGISGVWIADEAAVEGPGVVGSGAALSVGRRVRIDADLFGRSVILGSRVTVAGDVVAQWSVRRELGARVEGAVQIGVDALPTVHLPVVQPDPLPDGALPPEAQPREALRVPGFASIADATYREVVVPGGSVLLLKGGQVVIERLVLEPGAQVNVVYPTDLVVGGLTIGAGAWLRPTSFAEGPADVRIFVTGARMITIGAGARVDAVVSAPRSFVSIGPDASLSGTVVAGQLLLGGRGDVALTRGCTAVGEACDGVDGDCDGRADEGLVPPVDPDAEGVCATAEATCEGAEGWRPADVAALDTYEADEARCDGLDNDCDGRVDEAHDLTLDPDNCGACGRACTAAEACFDGACGVLPCIDSFDCGFGAVCSATGRCAVPAQTYLKAFNAGAEDAFGTAAALSGDWLAVGAPGEDGGHESTLEMPDDAQNLAGAVYMYARGPEGWTLAQYLKADPPPFSAASFGASLDMQGGRLVVGAPIATNQDDPRGRILGGMAYVYALDPVSGLWTSVATLNGHNQEGNDRFGDAVALDGDRILVGSPREDSSRSIVGLGYEIDPDGEVVDLTNNFFIDAGAAYLFERQGDGAWLQTAYIKSPRPDPTDRFGHRVDIDGDRLVVGAPGESGDRNSTLEAPNNGRSFAGAAYVFERNDDGLWPVTAYLKARFPSDGDQVGWAVAIEEGRIVVGGIEAFGDSSDTGAAFVFDRDPDTGEWVRTQRLSSRNAAYVSRQGYAVDIEGGRIVVGLTNVSPEPRILDGVSRGGAGAFAVFEEDADGAWVEVAFIMAQNPSRNARVGSSLSLDGDRLAVGALEESWGPTSTIEGRRDGARESGAAYVMSFEEGEVRPE